MKALHMIAFLLLVVGGLNWGLEGAFHYNLVHTIFGFSDMVERLVYILVGLSAIYEVVTHKQNCKMCATSSTPAM